MGCFSGVSENYFCDLGWLERTYYCENGRFELPFRYESGLFEQPYYCRNIVDILLPKWPHCINRAELLYSAYSNSGKSSL